MKINAKKTNWFKKYRKNTWKASCQPISIVWGYLFLLILAGLLIWAYILKQQSEPLLSPIAVGVMPVYAKESVRISCEDPRGYLECLAYQKVITWDQHRIMKAIGEAESHFKPNARNGKSTARGVFQIIAGTWYNYDCVGDKYDFKDNTNCAIKIMKISGYSQWEVFNTGSYKQYLDK